MVREDHEEQIQIFPFTFLKHTLGLPWGCPDKSGVSSGMKLQSQNGSF